MAKNLKPGLHNIQRIVHLSAFNRIQIDVWLGHSTKTVGKPEIHSQADAADEKSASIKFSTSRLTA